MLNILVPTDYSGDAKNAFKYAFQFAKQTGSKIIAHHTMPITVPISDIPFENYYINEEEELNTLKESVENFCIQNGLNINDVSIKYHINSSDSIPESISKAYKSTNADLIIMGTHGASGFKKFIIGSNTSRLIASYNVPVLAVPANYIFEPIYHIVYASDLKKLASELEFMVPLASIFQAVLDVYYFDYASPESEKLMLQAEQVIRKNAYKNIKLTVIKGKLEQPISKQILNNINSSNTQLITLFRGTKSLLQKLLTGSTTQQIVMESKVPVLVLKKSED
jgi:nucleotide-binding universal stress UspA family protein